MHFLNYIHMHFNDFKCGILWDGYHINGVELEIDMYNILNRCFRTNITPKSRIKLKPWKIIDGVYFKPGSHVWCLDKLYSADAVKLFAEIQFSNIIG